MTTFVKTVDSDAARIQTLLATSHSSHWSSTSVYYIVCLFVCFFFYLKAFWFYFQSCNYKRIVELLLRAALVHHDDFIQRTAIALCNLLVCQVFSARNLILWYVQTWEQWGPSGENARLAPKWRGLKSWCQQGWIEFVICPLLCFQRFFSSFSLSSKTNIPNIQFYRNCLLLVRIRGPQVY